MLIPALNCEAPQGDIASPGMTAVIPSLKINGVDPTEQEAHSVIG